MYLVLSGLPFPATIMARLTVPWTGRRTRIAVDIFVFAAIEMAALGQSHRQNPHRLLLVQPAGALRKGFPRSRLAWIARFRFFPLHKAALPPMWRVSAITLPLPATRNIGKRTKALHLQLAEVHGVRHSLVELLGQVDHSRFGGGRRAT